MCDIVIHVWGKYDDECEIVYFLYVFVAFMLICVIHHLCISIDCRPNL